MKIVMATTLVALLVVAVIAPAFGPVLVVYLLGSAP